MLDQQDTIPTLKTLSNFDISTTQDDDNMADSAYYDSSADPKEIPPDPPNDDFLLMMALRKFPLLESAVYSKLEILQAKNIKVPKCMMRSSLLGTIVKLEFYTYSYEVYHSISASIHIK